MSPLRSLGLYTAAILCGALAGGVLPLLRRPTRSDLGLSFSAGVMLGVAFFHMLPEAIALGGPAAAPAVLAGFLLLYLLERFVLVHVCAEPGVNARLTTSPAGVGPSPGAAALSPGLPASFPPPHGQPGHLHVHGDATGCDVHTLGMAAFVGMSLHTAVDGFALGAASIEPGLGLLVFLAILAHKVPNAFSLSTILLSEGWTRARAVAMNAAFALMVPVGAGLYLVLRRLLDTGAFTAFALAASAGTFLHLALSDILPDLHRRGGSKVQLSGALLLGIALAWALRLVAHV